MRRLARGVGQVGRASILTTTGHRRRERVGDDTVRGAVKIVVEHVLRVRMVYVAIYLNIDYASG